MASNDNKAIVSRYYNEVLNQRRLDVLDEIAAEDYVEHDPFPGQGNGRADLKARAAGLHNAFNPLRFTVEDVIAEGDRVAVRWTNAGTDSGGFMGIPPTGKEFGIAGIDIHVVRDGRLAEHWHVVDLLGQMQQVGLIPAPDGDPS
ncbi:MAG TPA: ester cyclase [Candidatus Dormibacteraeota bacterium]